MTTREIKFPPKVTMPTSIVILLAQSSARQNEGRESAVADDEACPAKAGICCRCRYSEA
jgi:hypothetical protein